MESQTKTKYNRKMSSLPVGGIRKEGKESEING
jgi:hypothetical protein